MKVCQTELPEEGLILVAARPGMGKSYVMIEMAHEMNQKGIKAMLLYTDGQKSHETVRYKEGEVQAIPSKLVRVKSTYPDIPYVVEDVAETYDPYNWQRFLNDVIKREKPKALFINSLTAPCEKASSKLLSTLQAVAKEKHVLIFAEINVSRCVERRKDKRPTPRGVMCAPFARRYVDCYGFVYRDCGYYDVTAQKETVSKEIEVYTSKETKNACRITRRNMQFEIWVNHQRKGRNSIKIHPLKQTNS